MVMNIAWWIFFSFLLYNSFSPPLPQKRFPSPSFSSSPSSFRAPAKKVKEVWRKMGKREGKDGEVGRRMIWQMTTGSTTLWGETASMKTCKILVLRKITLLKVDSREITKLFSTNFRCKKPANKFCKDTSTQAIQALHASKQTLHFSRPPPLSNPLKPPTAKCRKKEGRKRSSSCDERTHILGLFVCLRKEDFLMVMTRGGGNEN